MNIIVLFALYLALFSYVGLMRGWAKDIVITLAVILALALNHVLRRYVPMISNLFETDPSLFWIRVIILVVLTYFGYQTVKTIPPLASRSIREGFRDRIFGLFVGAFNGYLVIGTIWFYMHIADYFLPNIVSKPTEPAILQTVNQMMLYMAPQILGEPGIYFALILVFVVVLVVYI